ncbi:alpha/beta hydrolase [Thermasporomyces composti]|jgi:alpha-beta hydrolase superfamily lysophospholipase|uniref:Alpha-beta hydrolase superfamily lysophospholipase n=1 Tax=Thermasporomyces composti TaxID=696763 RepID=A0A3D9VA00_THECX|nr:alpha/beta hydrolase [Thermasporomyces composti]REF35825.1 alpha-beta hydrolase superfamily lysophospholipase [Thermasporomyces composti]
MAAWQEWSFDGTRGRIVGRTWPNDSARYLALLVHGYGEHIGRYEHVADTLVRHGAEVVGADHMGHGRSAGERVLITDYEEVVDDLHTVDERARSARPGLPVVLIGHSMGGMIATRYAQRYADTLCCVVLSGPVLGVWSPTKLLQLDEIPDTPLDITTLSRDPAVGQRYAADPLVWHGPFKRPTLQALATCLETINAGPRLELPTLWAHGGDDQLVPLAETQVGIDHIRGSRFTERIYPGARHEIFNETNKDEVLADVTAFIDQHLPG